MNSADRAAPTKGYEFRQSLLAKYRDELTGPQTPTHAPETPEQAADDRDMLCATIERLYDGIDAALAQLSDFNPGVAVPHVPNAVRILRNLRSVTE